MVYTSPVRLVCTGSFELWASHSEDEEVSENSISESMSELEFSLQQLQEEQCGDRIYIDKDKVCHVNFQIVEGLVGCIY